MYKKILFPTDLSDAAPQIVPHLLAIANKFDAEIHILFVARMLDYFASIYVTQTTIKGFQDEVVSGAGKKLDEFVKEHFKGYSPCKTHVLIGDPAEKILEFKRSEGIDLVVIGSHGRKGIDRIVFGSVAETVVRKSQVPVMTIHPTRLPGK